MSMMLSVVQCLIFTHTTHVIMTESETKYNTRTVGCWNTTMALTTVSRDVAAFLRTHSDCGAERAQLQHPNAVESYAWADVGAG